MMLCALPSTLSSTMYVRPLGFSVHTGLKPEVVAYVKLYEYVVGTSVVDTKAAAAAKLPVPSSARAFPIRAARLMFTLAASVPELRLIAVSNDAEAMAKICAPESGMV